MKDNIFKFLMVLLIITNNLLGLFLFLQDNFYYDFTMHWVLTGINVVSVLVLINLNQQGLKEKKIAPRFTWVVQDR